MRQARLGRPALAVVAHRPQAESALDPGFLAALVHCWSEGFAEHDWLIDRAAGIALHKPDVANEAGGMLLRGTLRVGSASPIADAPDLATAIGRSPHATIGALRGSFTLIHWDSASRTMTCARDPLGRRALFHRRVSDHTVFCSEPGPLVDLPGGTGPLVDRRSLFWFLAFGGPFPGTTLTDGLHQLPAGHLLQWTPGSGMIGQRYWTPLGAPLHQGDEPEFVQAVLQALRDALVGELKPAPRYCLSLSGGVDSTLLLALATELDLPPELALNVRFEAGFDANEDDYAAFAARNFGVPFEAVTLESGQALALFEQVVGQLIEPCAAWAALSHAALLGRTRAALCDSLLSGYGADEIFGGYDHFRIAALAADTAARRAGTAPGSATHQMTQLDPTGFAARSAWTGVARFFDNGALRRHLLPPFNRWRQDLAQRAFYQEGYGIDPAAEPVAMMIAHECQHRIPDIVLKSFEPLAARYGVETAYPFLDPDLCRIATALTLTGRYRDAQGRFQRDRRRLLPQFKWALNRIAAAHVPAAITARPRKSYTAPFALWMRDPAFSRRVLDMIAGSRLWQLGMIRRDALDSIVAGLEAGPGPRAHELWCLLVLARWCDVHAVR